MTLTPVESSNIQAVGHDPATSELHIRFHSGKIYQFANVSAGQHAEFMAAPSKGQHFHRNFRGRPEHQKLK